VKKIFAIALGILAAIGGFVDIGDIVLHVPGRGDVRLRAAVGCGDWSRRDIT
jgi:hypothetical protein